jgi:hypothetical protein
MPARFPDTKNLLIATAITTVISLAGFALFEADLIDYGFTLFVVTPIIVGYVLGQFPGFWFSLYMSGVLGTLIFLYLLYMSELEGLFCVITLLPLILVLQFIGLFIGYYLKKELTKNKEKDNKTVRTVIIPLVVLIFAGAIEKFFAKKYADVKVETLAFYPYPPETVFDYIKSVNKVEGRDNFWFSIGLQKPLRCVLEKDSVGAQRTCYFKEGTIDEIVTDYKRGEALKMKVTRYNMPGRKWLHFEDAIYLFKPVKNGTELTRVTTYKTELKPRFYWEYIEVKAIKAEHDYVLNDLRRRLDNDLKP